LFVGDRHVTAVPYYQNSPLLGRLLAERGDQPYGALYLLPLWNPVLVAEQVGTLASLAPGRFILLCTIGGDEQQFAGMGSDHSRRPSHFEAGLDIIRRLLAGETVSADGPYRARGAVVSPVPPEPVEVWVGGTAERAVDRRSKRTKWAVILRTPALRRHGARLELGDRRPLPPRPSR
jgi:alkanesulfonate monooxygenase SsuD/methylene tetrahydromethanopterin reductase-like flavin-dependent oxidoreductase (luciferase family)